MSDYSLRLDLSIDASRISREEIEGKINEFLSEFSQTCGYLDVENFELTEER